MKQTLRPRSVTHSALFARVIGAFFSTSLKISLYIVFASIVSSLVSLSAQAEGSAESVHQKTKIGVIIPLTGGWANWGAGIRRGLEITNELLQNEFDLIFEDEGACETAKGVRAAQFLFSQDIRILVIGCVGTTHAVIPDANRLGAIIFSAGLLDRHSFDLSGKVINWATQVGTEAEYLARYIKSSRYKSVAVVRANEPFGEELATVLSSKVKEQGITVLFDDKDAFATNDFSSTVLRITQKKPDVVVINLAEAQQLSFLKKLRSLGSKTAVLSTYGLESNTTSADDIGYLEGVTYTYPINIALQSSEKESFDRAFTEKFKDGATPNSTSYFVRDGLVLLKSVLSTCVASDTNCIFEAFRRTGKSRGISGEMTYRLDGSADRPYGIKRVLNGKFTWISPAP